MRKLIAFAAIAALTACSQAEAPEAEPEEVAVAEPAPAAEHAAGKYEYTDGDFTGPYEIRADGTYTSAGPEGDASGTYTQEGARTCFDPEGDGENLGEECWTRSAAAADGSFTAVSETDGRTVSVRVASE
ncbi:hypothetical protein [Qipengyuania zhejiangensis]|uniref:hypothetical protein n=1 Tax=Qipengyuania zhejiangensis TaxID=3077782 RepID=UPI002D785ADA|nr:hypothetical protein [Qipengyuania sp. Z2]